MDVCIQNDLITPTALDVYQDEILLENVNLLNEIIEVKAGYVRYVPRGSSYIMTSL